MTVGPAIAVLLPMFLSVRGQPLFRSYESEIEFRDKEITSQSMWQHFGVVHVLDCAVNCILDRRCKTYSYTRSQWKCSGYSGTVHFYKDKLKDVKGSIVARRFRKGSVSHGKTCTDKVDCNIDDSVCYDTRCLCKLGYYYSPNQNACLRECKEYGNEMDTYREAGIRGHNAKTYQPVPSADLCLKKCVEEKNFLCLTVDYKDVCCILSRKGYLDVSKSRRETRETGAKGWIFGQRQCK